jgi:hypothetical protein
MYQNDVCISKIYIKNMTVLDEFDKKYKLVKYYKRRIQKKLDIFYD